jgi:hypothetical protein
MAEKKFGLDERRTASQERNVNSQIRSREQAAALDQRIFQQGAKKAADAIKAGVTIGAKDRRAVNNDVTGLTKSTSESYNAARALSKLSEKASPTDQLAAIFKFMKSLDPTSVVREGEQQMARSTGGPADALVGMINQAQGEGGLTKTAFTNMVNTARSIANSDINSANLKVADYLDAYEDTLPRSFKEKLQNRVPTKLSVGESSQSVAPNIGRFKIEVVN